MNKSNRPNILTWHIHGSYLYYLTQTPCEFYLPVKNKMEEGYGGKAGTFSWGENVHEVHVDEIRNMQFDLILFQSKRNYLEDQYEILTEKQRALPKIYVEHDPPREHPTDTKHMVDDPNMVLVHVTHFNNLMWDNNRTPTVVIEHGVTVPEDVRYKGTKKRGIVVINNLQSRGRRLGLDIFKQVQKHVPLDLVGMNSEKLGGLGEVQPHEIASFISEYRFFFNPIRYTSLGLAVCEALMVGMPVVGMATTEMSTVIENYWNGYIDTDMNKLIAAMHMLLKEDTTAHLWSDNARKYAQKRFGIERFKKEWLEIFNSVIHQREPIHV